jgi:hypothetical protein
MNRLNHEAEARAKEFAVLKVLHVQDAVRKPLPLRRLVQSQQIFDLQKTIKVAQVFPDGLKRT